MELQEQLRRQIVRSSESYYEIAKASGVHRATIRALVEGHSGITLRTAEKLARHFQMDILLVKKRKRAF